MPMTVDGAPVAAVDAGRRCRPAPTVARRRRRRARAAGHAGRARRARRARRTSAAARRSRSAASAATRAGRCAPATCSPVGADADGAARPRCRRAGARARPRRGRSACSSARTRAPDFLTPAGLDALLRADWEVHFNSARTGVRLIGPRPRLGPRATAARPGCTRRTSTTPATPSAPSTSPATCRSSSGPTGRASAGSCARPSSRRPSGGSSASWRPATGCAWCRGRPTRGGRRPTPPAAWLAPGDDAGRAAGPPVVERGRSPAPGARDDGVLARRRADGDHPGVTYRRAGDRFLLVEYGADDARPRAAAAGPRARPVGRASTCGRRRRRHRRASARCSSRSTATGSRSSGAPALLPAAEDDLGDVEHAALPSRVVHLPLSWDDPATREAIERYMHGVRADAPWCPWNIEFIRRINGLDAVDDVRRIVFDASYLVLGLGDVYLGAPVATPLDPRHRLVTTKYNPARTWTPENAVGIGGAYLCIYGMEGPGGYQFVGRTVQVWNRDRRGPHFDRAVAAAAVRPAALPPGRRRRAARPAGRSRPPGGWRSRIETTTFRLADHRALPRRARRDEIDAFRATPAARPSPPSGRRGRRPASSRRRP